MVAKLNSEVKIMMEIPENRRKLYRKYDPYTSREAAESLDLSRLEDIVLSVISGFPDGCISDQVINVCMHKHAIRKYPSVTARYKSLSDKGLIFYTGEKRRGESGRNQRVMFAKERQGNLL